MLVYQRVHSLFVAQRITSELLEFFEVSRLCGLPQRHPVTRKPSSGRLSEVLGDSKMGVNM